MSGSALLPVWRTAQIVPRVSMLPENTIRLLSFLSRY
jgi:hypothetical protein